LGNPTWFFFEISAKTPFEILIFKCISYWTQRHQARVQLREREMKYSDTKGIHTLKMS